MYQQKTTLPVNDAIGTRHVPIILLLENETVHVRYIELSYRLYCFSLGLTIIAYRYPFFRKFIGLA